MDRCIHFCKCFSTLKKLGQIEDWIALYRLSVAYIHFDTTLINNEPVKIYVHPT